MIDEDDLAARLHHPDQFVERRLRLRHDRQHVRRDDGVEMGVGEGKAHRVHHDEALDIAERLGVDAPLRAPQHRFGEIDADQRRARIEHRQFEARADADVENAPARALGRRRRGPPPRPQQQLEDEVIDRRPASVGRFDVDIVENGGVFGGAAPSKARASPVKLRSVKRPLPLSLVQSAPDEFRFLSPRRAKSEGH